MNNIMAPVTQELQALEPLLVQYLLTPNEPTNQVIAHIFAAGGKRVRPALFLLCSQLLNYQGENKFPIASVCEYIHTASLLHDDVIDNSTLRRNKPTVNSVWGDETSVLAGDLIYSAACRLMVKTQSLALIDTFAECIRFMSESELFQLELLWKIDTTEDQYNRVVAGKTAALFEASCKTPGYLAQAPEELTAALGEYGKALGYAFQIADDCLDYEGAPEDMGKSLVADLLEGKVTLPLIYSLKNPGSQTQELRTLVEQILEQGEASTAQKEQLVTLIRGCEGVARAKNVAQDYAKTAHLALTKALALLPETAAQLPAARSLKDLVSSVIDRKN